MVLSKRVARLEGVLSQAAPRQNSTDRLIEMFETVADRCDGVVLDEAWCSRASPMEIASLCYHELGTGERSTALWAKAEEIKGRGGTVEELFGGLLSLAHQAQPLEDARKAAPPEPEAGATVRSNDREA